MRDLEISKELLSEVLKLEVVKHSLFNKSNNSFNITYMQSEDSLKSSWMPINIYEFAFKCKEWILNQKNKDCFYIADQFSLNIESQMGVIKYFWCVLLKNNSRVSPEFKADSELEAIIKACEFILIKKESK